ncbi:NAD/NADP octopine/nopaline dehydrogenase family protein [Rhizobium leguminosarum]|uniref:NAD/NADP octopine/nopaline dehydrogenase family protein n=1 Tax=Rhizobium leguminosarum TaxID=384 RepID=UPI0028ADF765|nr:NAD/NADP octopine/nopaline dehydrogenase family protein [Rhizobium leguminosarum]
MTPGLTVGILGAGHAGTAMAAWFASKKIPVVIWGPSDHRGYIPKIDAQNGTIMAKGVINGKFHVSTSEDVGTVACSATLLIIITRADAHESFVSELAKLGNKLNDKDIIVVCGQGFALNFEKRLRSRRILEISNSPAACKVADGEKVMVHIKEMKATLGISCFPTHRNESGVIDFPDDVKHTLSRLFPTTQLTPTPPLQAAFGSNYVTHAVSAMLNIGRLPDPAGTLSQRAEGWLRELKNRAPMENGFFFYGQGSNGYVCKVQDLVDNERRAVANACGIRLPPLLQECNEEYNTDYATLREYCLAPSPHNVQYACPNDIEHRYFSEELRSLEGIAAIAEVVKVQVPLTLSHILIIQAARGKPAFESALYKSVREFTRDDLILFGATFTADD